ncbi:MAG TPA: hypothetical protein GXZ36_00770 [Firmicutes bacterium]|nr:hypothetical protein [Bacillota bacterium]
MDKLSSLDGSGIYFYNGAGDDLLMEELRTVRTDVMAKSSSDVFFFSIRKNRVEKGATDYESI